MVLAESPLMQMQMPKDHRPGTLQPMNDGRVLVGHHLVSGGGKGRRVALDLEQVLDADRHAVQRATPAPFGDLGFSRLCRCDGGFGLHQQIGVELWVERADPVEDLFGERHW